MSDRSRQHRAHRWQRVYERLLRLYPSEFRDLRYALRAICQARAFASVVILTLALGIGANTAIFSVIHAALLRGLPYQDPAKLAIV